MMIGREADQSRGERESPRALTPEVVAARIELRVAELRVLANRIKRGSSATPRENKLFFRANEFRANEFNGGTT